MRTSRSGAPADTFTRGARRGQLVGCAIDSIVELGYQRTSVAEVARRAGVSKGVVTYHFANRDDLIRAAIAEIFDSITEHVGSRLTAAAPEHFIGEYLTAWVDYYREHRGYMLAIAEIWTGFRDPDGRPYLDVLTLSGELTGVEHALAAAQTAGHLRPFSTRVMAVSLKGALDALLGQLAADPTLDLEAYLAELIATFDRAARPDDQ